MASFTTVPWADSPFPLIATSKITKPATHPDAIWLADQMANVHNCFLRALNAMYQQAPYIELQSDVRDFCWYGIFWGKVIHHHHEGEENLLFPAIAKITGERGIMERNSEQHHAFAIGLEAFMTYVKDCIKINGLGQRYDAGKFRGLIDQFGSDLASHLEQEITTLLALEKYNVRALKEEYRRWDALQQKMNKSILFPMVLGARDNSFEGGNTWPDVPFIVPYLVQYWFARKYRSVWRFSPCTPWGEKRELIFGPKSVMPDDRE